MASLTITITNNAEAQEIADAVNAKFGYPATIPGVKSFVIDQLQRIRKEYKQELRDRAAQTTDPDAGIT